MRKHLITLLTEIAEFDESVFLLTGDLGFGVIDEFEKKHPDRFLNCGVAEQAMIGVASGLAASGYKPICYSIANFAGIRPLEQIRNDLAHQGLPALIISLGAGFSYGTAGYSHFGIEDGNAVASIAGSTVVTPACVHEMSNLLSSWHRSPRLTYMRLGSPESCSIGCGEDEVDYSLRSFRRILGTGPIAVVSTGVIAEETVGAASHFGEQKVSVYSTPFFCPQEDFLSELERFEVVLTVEENYTSGSMGERLLAALCQRPTKFRRYKTLGVGSSGHGSTGSRAYHLRRNGLDADSLVNAISSLIDGTEDETHFIAGK